jgi:hypothetical protein
MADILSELALLTGSDILDREARDEARFAVDEAVLQRFDRAWTTTRSSLAQYSRLVEGQGYEFNSITNPVTPVGHAKSPLLPLLIQVVPPDYYPTGQTRTIEISSPQNAPVRLEEFTETIKRRAFNNDPRDQRFEGSSRTVERIINATPDSTITVDVPELTPSGAEAQVRRTQSFLQTTQERYRAFQTQGRAAQLELANKAPIREDKAEVEDPTGQNANVKRARQEQVSGDLDYLRQQALQLLDLPPLFMYVNPTTFSLSHEFIASDGNRSRNGYIVEIWGEQLPKISMSGEVGAFWTDTKNAAGQKTGGLSVRYRKGSYAYQNFLSLYQIYRNNGYLYTQKKEGAVRIGLVGSVNLYYDGTIYTGSFDSLQITHSEDKPYTLSYQFSFTVRFRQDFRDFRTG